VKTEKGVCIKPQVGWQAACDRVGIWKSKWEPKCYLVCICLIGKAKGNWKLCRLFTGLLVMFACQCLVTDT